MRLNLTTAVVTTRETLPALIERGGGSIVLTSSVAGLTAAGALVTYTTAKTALLGFVRSVAVDYGPQGVRVNAVCPGGTRTRMLQEAIDMVAKDRGVDEARALEIMNTGTPLRRFADPSELAKVNLFLASDDASFVTGSTTSPTAGSPRSTSGCSRCWSEREPRRHRLRRIGLGRGMRRREGGERDDGGFDQRGDHDTGIVPRRVRRRSCATPRPGCGRHYSDGSSQRSLGC